MTALHVGDRCLTGTEVSPLTMAEQARKHLSGVYYDTIVGTGMSGALVVPVLARELDCNWLILRKPGDHHHHPGTIFGGYSPGQGSLGHRWLFADDGIRTGGTLRRVRRQVDEIAARAGHATSFAGAYLFGDHNQNDVYGRAGEYLSPGQVTDVLKQIERYAA
jgi:adenine/guanine phosphoribosyltransferase-like PRPP-binding protein